MSFTYWESYEDDRLYQHSSGAYSYKTSLMALDADGSPHAYHPDGHSGLDALANAGYPNKGWRSVLVVDPADASQPYIAPNGFYVSRTSLYDEDLAVPETEARKYVNS